MDRFIGGASATGNCSGANLKSNMDRFIVLIFRFSRPPPINLKSNMDRFIAIEKSEEMEG